MSKIEQWKKEFNSKTSEDLFGLVPPVDHQCKFIDDIRDKVGTIEKCSNVRRRDEEDIEVLRDKLFNIEYEVHGLEDEVDEIRTRIEEVRAWGQEWKDLCKKIIEKHEVKLEDV